MEKNLQTIDIRRFKSLFPDSLNAEMGDDFFIADFDVKEGTELIEFPCRPDGYVALFCVDGKMNVDINVNSYEVVRNTLLISIPGNILRIHKDRKDSLRLFVVAVDADYFASINMDYGNVFNDSVTLLTHPCITFDAQETALLTRYVDTGTAIMTMDLDKKHEIIGALISSVSYFLISTWLKRQEGGQEGERKERKEANNRANAVFDQFIRLVNQYHTRERTVAFYASRLYLTPKYLSKLVKSVSGKSAPEWISSFVILEAKNLLKYSDLTISEIVYKLNFTSQSVFYKFFKCHTGMTPSDYRNK